MEKRRKEMMKIGLIIIYLVLTMAGLILMKRGGNPGSLSMAGGDVNFGINLVSMAGFICYICSFLLFTRMVVMFDLSFIMPLSAGIVQVLTLIASYFIFKEQIGVKGVIGASMIIIGIIVMNLRVPN